jgi:hypothetical protein
MNARAASAMVRRARAHEEEEREIGCLRTRIDAGDQTAVIQN